MAALGDRRHEARRSPAVGSRTFIHYRALFGEYTGRMNLLFTFAKLVMPEGFVMPDQRVVFDIAFSKLTGMNMARLESPCAKAVPSVRIPLSPPIGRASHLI
jgi:hypothetical protein